MAQGWSPDLLPEWPGLPGQIRRGQRPIDSGRSGVPCCADGHRGVDHLKGGPFGEADELLYLGRAFDPLGLGNDPKTVAELNVQKIKNSHLAMSCVFGYYVQAVVNGESPSSAGAVAECLNGEHPEDCGRDPASLVHARDLSFLFCLSYVLLVVCCL